MKIGLIGLIGSGKNTVGDILEKSLGYEKHSFAEPLKDTLSAIYGWDRALLEGDTEESRAFRETKDLYWSERLGRDIIPRKELQVFGTEVVRQHYHENIWVESLLARIKNEKNVVITDVRFVNEMEALYKAGVTLVRVSRNDPQWLNDLIVRGIKPEGVHISEIEWVQRRSLISYTIHNNGDLGTLSKTVKLLAGLKS